MMLYKNKWKKTKKIMVSAHKFPNSASQMQFIWKLQRPQKWREKENCEVIKRHKLCVIHIYTIWVYNEKFPEGAQLLITQKYKKIPKYLKTI